MGYSAEDLLLEREKRVKLQETLQAKFHMPILVVRVNYPGINKENELTRSIIEDIESTVYSAFQSETVYKILRFTAEGPNLTMVINKEARDIKKIAMDIENKHILGRVLDIDVYDHQGKGLSRKELGYPVRACYLCEDMAQNCVRARKHREKDVIEFISNTYKEYREKFYEKKP